MDILTSGGRKIYLLVCIITFAHGMELTASPGVIVPGVTRDLDLNCSLTDPDRAQHMTSLSSLHISISRHNETFGFEALSSEDAFGHTASSDHASRSFGVLSQTGDSYLSVQMFWPTKNAQAWYVCEAFGFSNVGLPVKLSTQPTFVELQQRSQPVGFDLSISPLVFSPGDTPTLNVTCALPNSTKAGSGMAAINSMIMSYSHIGPTSAFVDLVATTSFGKSFSALSNPTDSVSGNGNIAQHGSSSLRAVFDHPNDKFDAWFKCEAFGNDNVGHHLVLSTEVVRVRSTSSTTGPGPDTPVTTTTATATAPSPSPVLTTTTFETSTSPKENQMGLQLTTSSDVFILGMTIEINFNCTMSSVFQSTFFNDDMSSITLVLLHRPQYETNFNGFLAINGYGHTQLLNTSFPWGYRHGRISKDKTSFLTTTVFHYDLTDTLSGFYQCQAKGLDALGRSVTFESPVIELKSVHPTEKLGLDLNMIPDVIRPGVTTEFTLNCTFQTSQSSTTLYEVRSLVMFLKTGYNTDFGFYVYSDTNTKPKVINHFDSKLTTNATGFISDKQLSYLEVQITMKDEDYFKHVEYKCKALVRHANGDFLMLTSNPLAPTIQT